MRLVEIDRRLKPSNMLRRLCASVEAARAIGPNTFAQAQEELRAYAEKFARCEAGGSLPCSAGDMDRARSLLLTEEATQ